MVSLDERGRAERGNKPSAVGPAPALRRPRAGTTHPAVTADTTAPTGADAVGPIPHPGERRWTGAETLERSYPDLGQAPGHGCPSSAEGAIDRTRDLNASTPLFWAHVNPYGRFELDVCTRITALA